MDNLLICFKKKIAPRQNFNIDVCELLPVYILLYIYCWNEVEGIMDSSK